MCRHQTYQPKYMLHCLSYEHLNLVRVLSHCCPLHAKWCMMYNSIYCNTDNASQSQYVCITEQHNMHISVNVTPCPYQQASQHAHICEHHNMPTSVNITTCPHLWTSKHAHICEHHNMPTSVNITTCSHMWTAQHAHTCKYHNSSYMQYNAIQYNSHNPSQVPHLRATQIIEAT